MSLPVGPVLLFLLDLSRERFRKTETVEKRYPLETDAITIRPKSEDGAIHQAIYEGIIR